VGAAERSTAAVRAGREAGPQGAAGGESEGAIALGGHGSVDQETALRAKVVTIIKGKSVKGCRKRARIQLPTAGTLPLRKGEASEGCGKAGGGGGQDEPGILGERGQEQVAPELY